MCLDRQGVKHGIIWWLVQSIAGDVQLPRRKAKRQAGAGVRSWFPSVENWVGKGSGGSRQHFELCLEAGGEERSQI